MEQFSFLHLKSGITEIKAIELITLIKVIEPIAVGRNKAKNAKH